MCIFVYVYIAMQKLAIRKYTQTDIDSPSSSSLYSPLAVCMQVAVQRWHQRRSSRSDECSAQWPPLALGPSGVRDTQSTGYCAHTHNHCSGRIGRSMAQYGQAHYLYHTLVIEGMRSHYYIIATVAWPHSQPSSLCTASQNGSTYTEVCRNMQKLHTDDAVTHTPSIVLHARLKCTHTHTSATSSRSISRSTCSLWAILVSCSAYVNTFPSSPSAQNSVKKRLTFSAGMKREEGTSEAKGYKHISEARRQNHQMNKYRQCMLGQVLNQF